MKMFAPATCIALLGFLAGCQEAINQTISSTGSQLSGVATFRSGTATALAADSSVIATAALDSNGSFTIPLPEGAQPVYVRADSSGSHFWSFVPPGRRSGVVVDSATLAILDSLKRSGGSILRIDSSLWDSLRIVRETHRRTRDSLNQKHDSKSAADTCVVPGKYDTSYTPPTHPVVDTSYNPPAPPSHPDTSRIDTSWTPAQQRELQDSLERIPYYKTHRHN